MKSDNVKDQNVIVYSLNMAEACALIASLANQMAAIDKGLSHGVVSMGCDGVRIVFGINCIA